jgi:hypothetical protein
MCNKAPIRFALAEPQQHDISYISIKGLHMKNLLKTHLMYALMAVFLAGTIHAPAMADIVDNQQLAIQHDLQLQRDDVLTLMARDDVRNALLTYGVTASDVDQRINNLTEGELLQIQNRLDTLPAGEGALGVVLTLLLIFILLDLLGVTNIFPRI